MRKDILAKAVRLADKSKARPDKVVIGKPAPTLFVKKPPAQVRSERLHTRLTPSEMQRLKGHLGKTLTLANDNGTKPAGISILSTAAASATWSTDSATASDMCGRASTSNRGDGIPLSASANHNERTAASACWSK